MFDPMTSTVPRRLFEETTEEQPMERLSKEAELRNHGMIRATGIIPIEYNERLKAMARKQGKNADQLIGELLLEMRPTLDKWEIHQEAVRLREQFGDNWLELFQQAG